MDQKTFAPAPLLDDSGNRKFDPHFLQGRYVMNLSGCEITIEPEPEAIFFLTRYGKKLIDKVTLQHNESIWLDNFFIVPTSADGRRILMPQTFNAEGLEKLKEAVKNGLLKG